MVTQFGWQRLPVHIRPCLVEHELDMVNMMKVVMVMITINEMKFLVPCMPDRRNGIPNTR